MPIYTIRMIYMSIMATKLKVIWVSATTKQRLYKCKGEGMTTDRIINDLLDIKSKRN